MPMMKNSKLDDGWLQRSVANNPIQLIMDPQTNKWTGNIRTCPVRLTWVFLLKAREGKVRDNGQMAEGKFGADLLFPPGAETGIAQVMWPAWYEMCRKEFPERFDAYGQYIHTDPWVKKQASKHTFPGFTPGLDYISTTTKYRPQIVDPNMQPITNPERVYAGAWAICAVNPFVYGKSPPQPRKGVGWGLQSVMLIADDERLSGGAIDPSRAFAGTRVDAAFNPATAFGVPGAPGMPPQSGPGGFMPPPTNAGGYPQPPAQMYGAPPGGVPYTPPPAPGVPGAVPGNLAMLKAMGLA